MWVYLTQLLDMKLMKFEIKNNSSEEIYLSSKKLILLRTRPTKSKLRLANVNFLALVLNRNIAKKLRLYFINMLSRV